MNKKLHYIIAGLVIIFGLYLVVSDNPGFSPIDSETELATESQVVELKNGDTYNLTASIVKKVIAGKEVKMLAYNGSIPGPLIKVTQGSEVTINFKNETDVASTLHSHGIRLDNKNDGVPPETQKEITPGGTFSYKIKFPDAGLYWYHPHVREDYAQELGLYGGYLVTPKDSSYWNPINREVPLFIDDILMENGNVAPFDAKKADHTLMGRYGNVFLVNGSDAYSFAAKKNELIRFYITNVANVRPFNFVIPGVKMKLVGGDSGAYEKEQWVDAVVVSPSERAVVEVLFNKAGTYDIQNKTPEGENELGVVNVSENSSDISFASVFNSLKTHLDVVKSIDPFRSYFSKPLDKEIKLSVDMPGGMGMGGGHMMMHTSPDGIEWNDSGMMGMNNVNWKIIDTATGKENMDISWDFKVGDKVKIRITNDEHSPHPMQHPIHFHGQRFLVLNRNGEQQDNLVWKDTVLVPSGQYVDILLDVSNPGVWMAHCHIAEHLESGMMFNYTVK
jgi:FtsP/CotA-like multicopper oxidase with cupredoxin domain